MNMKIYILNESKQSLGGGWSFIRNFEKGINSILPARHFIVNESKDADIVFIPSASMARTDTVEQLKEAGKKIVLRLDNIPRNSRNRGAGTSRLKAMTDLADMVIYQCVWARDYLQPFVDKWGQVIYNGVDTEIFHPDSPFVDFGKFDNVVLYSRYSRDETKGWERAWYDFQMIHRKNKELGKSSKLVLVGQFSDELRQYNFDFYNGEIVQYMGVIDDPNYMANIMRGCDILLAPYFNDCYSNTIQEAMACGLELRVDISGGTPELLRNGVIDLNTMVTNYLRSFNELLS